MINLLRNSQSPQTFAYQLKPLSEYPVLEKEITLEFKTTQGTYKMPFKLVTEGVKYDPAYANPLVSPKIVRFKCL